MSLFSDLQYNFFGKLRQNLSVIRTCLKLALGIFKYRFTASEKTKKTKQTSDKEETDLKVLCNGV